MKLARFNLLGVAHRSLVQVALVAMFLHALMPAGWMPAQPGTGALLTICSAVGSFQADAPGKDGHHKGAPTHEVCPFAAAGHLAIPPAITTALLTTATPAHPAACEMAQQIRACVDSGHPARAPPRLA